MCAGIIGGVFAGWVLEILGIPQGIGIIELIFKAIPPACIWG
jgi:uncharacterized membrane protein YeaQ/YmgE (transglycosylase-associated protein family)